MALQLRTKQGAIEYMLHPHSQITRKLALAVVESDIYFQSNLAYVAAWGAMSSHPKLDINASLKGLNKVFNTAKGAIPYLEFMGKDTVDDESRKLAKRWHELNERGELEQTDG